MRTVLLLCLAALVTGCVTVGRPHQPDVPRPPTPSVTADYSKVFEVRAVSNSVTAAAAEKGLLRRVMLSPNLVFEASRSSVREPEVSGPRGGEGTPGLADALGKPVQAWLSSLLMNELVARGAALVAPAMSRNLADACEDAKCTYGTWVERVLVRFQRAATSAKGAEELSELPSTLLAVRELGLSWYETEVVAERASSGGDLVFRPRRSPGEPSACAPAKVELPIVKFSAEVLSLRDGRILARIDEARTPAVSGELRRPVEAAAFSPVNRWEFDGVKNYQYVAAWEPKDVSCDGALAAYKELREKVQRELDVQALARDLVANGLNRLAPRAP